MNKNKEPANNSNSLNYKILSVPSVTCYLYMYMKLYTKSKTVCERTYWLSLRIQQVYITGLHLNLTSGPRKILSGKHTPKLRCYVIKID